MSDSDTKLQRLEKEAWRALAEARKHLRDAQEKRAKAKEVARKGRTMEHVRR